MTTEKDWVRLRRLPPLRRPLYVLSVRLQLTSGEAAWRAAFAPPAPAMNLLVRLPNWLGDTVMAVPVLASLRAAWPEARVLAAGPWASLLAGQGLADVLLTYPRAWSGRLRAADAVPSQRPDAGAHPAQLVRGRAGGLVLGGRRRVGFAAQGRSWLLTDAVARDRPRCAIKWTST